MVGLGGSSKPQPAFLASNARGKQKGRSNRPPSLRTATRAMAPETSRLAFLAHCLPFSELNARVHGYIVRAEGRLAGVRVVKTFLTRCRETGDFVIKRSVSLSKLVKVAALVAAGDLATKWLASIIWAGNPVRVNDWISMAVIHNHGTAFGLSFGAYTWYLNLALTVGTIAFIIPVTRDLSSIDSSAPRALGLIMGAAVGNLASLLLPPPGVMDFIAVNWRPGHSLVLNVADVAAYTGLAMILRTGVRIAAALRRESGAVAEVRLGSTFLQKERIKERIRPSREQVPQLKEELVIDWSVVSQVGVVRADSTLGAPEISVQVDTPKLRDLADVTLIEPLSVESSPPRLDDR